jgi:hypothetical protein
VICRKEAINKIRTKKLNTKCKNGSLYLGQNSVCKFSTPKNDMKATMADAKVIAHRADFEMAGLG